MILFENVKLFLNQKIKTIRQAIKFLMIIIIIYFIINLFKLRII